MLARATFLLEEINKQTNIQRQAGVDRTSATLGLIAYSSVNKNKGHEAPLKEELLYRGVAFEDSAGFLVLKKLLMEHEINRVGSNATASKSFRRLSNAIFIGIETDSGPDPSYEFALAADL